MKLIEKGIELRFTEEERDAFGTAHDYLCDLIGTLKDRDLNTISIPKELSIDMGELEDTKFVLGKLYDYIGWDVE